MAKKTGGRARVTNGQIAFGFEASADVQAVREHPLPTAREPEITSVADNKAGDAAAILPKQTERTRESLDEYYERTGSVFIEHNGSNIHYSWYLKEMEAVEAVAAEQPVDRWLIDFKVYDVIFKSELDILQLHPSMFRKHPEGIVIKPDVYSIEGNCTEEEIKQLYKWASTRSDFKILGTLKLKTPVTDETARINLEDC